MANAIIPAAEVAATNQVTAPCRNHPDCPCHRAERAADKFDLAPPPFDYAPDVAGNDAGAARFRCPTEKG